MVEFKPRPWKPGQSGNPKGRPPKRYCLTSLLKEAMAEVCPQDKDKRTWAEVLTEKLLMMARKGDLGAIRLVFEYVEGKPTPRVIEDPEKVTILVRYADSPETDKQPEEFTTTLVKDGDPKELTPGS